MHYFLLALVPASIIAALTTFALQPLTGIAAYL